jgi:nitric oxide reductase large subunit
VPTTTAYRDRRDEAPRSTDVETASIHDLLARIKRVRRRVALPALIASAILAWLGGTLHVTGHWSLFGRLPDGGYYVSTATMILAAALSAAPVASLGAALYLAMRARMREAWLDEYRRKAVSDEWPEREEWLRRTSRRFG